MKTEFKVRDIKKILNELKMKGFLSVTIYLVKRIKLHHPGAEVDFTVLLHSFK